ncbi:MAG: hypothetical protein PXX77_06060 [Gallionella sp.]|nr:hypothetical protein [Gallionella sp.]
MVQQTSFSMGGVKSASHFPADFGAFSSMRISSHGRADFIYQLTLYFPEVAARIDESDFGILPLEIGVMTVATKDAIRRFDLYTVSRHFSFIGRLFDCADTELRNGIQIAYLENLLLGETSPAHVAARCLLPKSLKTALKQSESHFEQIISSGQPHALERNRLENHMDQ